MELDKLTYNSNRRQISIALNNFLLTVPPPALRSTSKSFSSFKKELKSFLYGLSFWSWQRYIDYIKRSSNSL